MSFRPANDLSPLIETSDSVSEARHVAKHSSGWKASTQKALGLVPTIFFSALLVVAIGILQFKSARDGAIYFFIDGKINTIFGNFMFQHLPTILATIYSLVWNWIDLDVKRLEPWIQLSSANGAHAIDSILLHYPVDFLAFVPVKAARRR